jgi:2-oxo-4-hydroxy-4-carboxy-5-ureidoimidazoline decarboxylase
MMDAVHAAPLPKQLAFLRGHPELAGKEAQAGTMTGHSTFEQRGLDSLTHEQFMELRGLNAAYAQRHGFPFIIAVLGHTRPGIFDALRMRVLRDTDAEREEALRQIGLITRRRLDALFRASETPSTLQKATS